MNVGFITTTGDELGGVFARSYRAAGGFEPALIAILPPREELAFRGVSRWVAAWKLLGLTGALRMIGARKLGIPLIARDRCAGLEREWISTLSGPTTRVAHVESLSAGPGSGMLRKAELDVLVSVGCPQILEEDVLESARLGALNLHNGRIPEYRGHFGTFWEVSQGESTFYTVIHRMGFPVDTGEVIKEIPVRFRDVPSFLDLMIAKKKNGGRALAHVLQETAERDALPRGREVAQDAIGDHYGWPSLDDLLRFSWPGTGRSVETDTA